VKQDSQIVEIARKKAVQSICRTKISAIGFNSNGDIVEKAFNKSRFSRPGGGIHAEMQILQAAKKKGITSILICRVNRSGNLLPVDPCETCQEKADELGVKIYTVTVNEVSS
jgi:hypothetical protein